MAKGKQAGFLEFQREAPAYRDIQVRIGDFMSVEAPLGEPALNRQVQRCMDCGVPFCHAYGCPVGNRVPDYCDELALGNWKRALELLHSTNNFPEFTGRICPALCEASCTLSLHDEPTICRHIEMQISERGWKEGWIQPVYPEKKTDKRVAIVGSGPSGLAAAQQLVRMGHEVVVFEQSDRIGGLLRYGIPNFKLEKKIIDRRLDQMVQEGVRFETETVVGVDLSARYLLKNYDAVLLALGTSKARDLPVPGRELRGIHPAMELLTQQTRLLSGDTIDPDTLIDPAGKDVVVIGGGDTGADCVGTVLRRGARSVVQVELLDAPPLERPAGNPWPEWPRILRTSSSHDEGCRQLWSVLTREFIGSEQVEGISCTEIQWEDRTFKEIPGSAFQLDAQLVLLSMGFSPDADSPVVKDFALATDDRGAVAVDERYHTSKERVFATGDVVTGASLVVRSIDHGRRCAEHLHRYLMD